MPFCYAYGRRKMSVNFTQLRYFVAVALNRNLTRAATELRVAQPAVSRQIKLLEDELGTSLLARHHRGVELTDAGVLLHRRSEFLLRQLDETRTEIMDLSEAPTGQLRLGCPPSLTRNLVSKPLERFLSRYPKVRVELQETISDQLCQAVLADQLDLAIISTLYSEPHLTTTTLYPEPIWLFGPPAKLNRRTPVRLDTIAGLPMLLALRGNATRVLLDRRMADARLPLNVIVETNSIPLIHELVHKGIGYTAAPFSSHQNSIANGAMSGAPIADLKIERSLVRRSDRPLTGAMQAFLIILEHEIDNVRRSLMLGLNVRRAERSKIDKKSVDRDA
jgi:LysR family nitrogen assimilation transcriptional regulator